MDLDDTIRYYGRNLRGLPGYGIIEKNYPRLANAVQNFMVDGSATLNGFYTIDPEGVDIEPFDLWITNGSHHNRLKVQGIYEKPVMIELNQQVNENTTFWEVGAAIGYFSIAMAQYAQEVIAFDTNKSSLQHLEKSANRNAFENISTICGKVGQNIDLESFETPDVVLMDIEGNEYKTLQSVPALLESHPTWIIEIHEPHSDNDFPVGNNPTEIINILSKYNYETKEIFRRRPDNYHILAE